MKSQIRRVALFAGIVAVLSTLCLSAGAQSYAINWYKIAGGGGTSSGGSFSLSGTIGQPDASGALTGGNYSLVGGFWGIVSVAQTPGAPTLYIRGAGNTVTVFWQAVTGWSLRQSSDLVTPIASWASNSSFTTSGGTNYLSLTNPSGNQYFRLSNP